jgi:phosphate transport system substrate-binding protein
VGDAIGVGTALKSVADLLGTHPDYLGIAIALVMAAPLADRYIIRRKRIHFRVLYNSKLGLSPVELHDGESPSAQTDPQLLQMTRLLDRMSIAIIRIRNTGGYDISAEDFEVPISFSFGRRIVWDARISEASTDDLRELTRDNMMFFDATSTSADPAAAPVNTGEPAGDLANGRESLGILRDWLGRRLSNWLGTEQATHAEIGPEWHGVQLPKLSLNRKEKFKLVVVLREPDDAPYGEICKDVQRRGRISSGRIQDEKQERNITWPRVATSIGVLLTGALIAALLVGSHPHDPSAHCASGTLRLVGSSAFIPTPVDGIAQKYKNSCDGATINTNASGSIAGVKELSQSPPNGGMAALSDGLVPIPGPQPQPVAVVVYAIAINNAAGLDHLTSDDIRRIYTGQVTNWAQLGGKDQEIKIVSRNEDSGTRETFQKIFLGRAPQAPQSSAQCDKRDMVPQAPITLCISNNTNDLLTKVNTTSGAIGYADAPAAEEVAKQHGLTVIRINDTDPDVNSIVRPGGSDPGYPFWTVEYLYTQGSPPDGSLLKYFLDYLSSDGGRAELRRAGYTPCVDKPELC